MIYGRFDIKSADKNYEEKNLCYREKKNMKYAVELYFDKKLKTGFWIWLKKLPVNLLK